MKRVQQAMAQNHRARTPLFRWLLDHHADRARLSDIDQAALPDAREGRAEQAQKAIEATQKAEEARRAAEAAQKAAEAAQEAVERQQAADEGLRTHWRSLPLNVLQREFNALQPDRDPLRGSRCTQQRDQVHAR